MSSELFTSNDSIRLAFRNAGGLFDNVFPPEAHNIVLGNDEPINFSNIGYRQEPTESFTSSYEFTGLLWRATEANAPQHQSPLDLQVGAYYNIDNGDMETVKKFQVILEWGNVVELRSEVTRAQSIRIDIGEDFTLRTSTTEEIKSVKPESAKQVVMFTNFAVGSLIAALRKDIHGNEHA